MDARNRLLARLAELQTSQWITTRPVTQVEWERSQDVHDEMANLEIALAQHDAANATREATEAQLHNTDAIQASTAQRENTKTDQDNANFWFRRFFSTVGVANAAAFGIFSTGTLQATSIGEAALLTANALAWFAAGAAAAGLIPFALWLRVLAKRRVPELEIPILAFVACLALYSGLCLAVGTHTATSQLQGIGQETLIHVLPKSNMPAPTPPV